MISLLAYDHLLHEKAKDSVTRIYILPQSYIGEALVVAHLFFILSRRHSDSYNEDVPKKAYKNKDIYCHVLHRFLIRYATSL